MRVKALTVPQARLLAEIREAGGLYITSHSRWSRTVRVLLDRGLIRCDERDFSPQSQHHYVAVEGDADA
jgi:hypothetical protein